MKILSSAPDLAEVGQAFFASEFYSSWINIYQKLDCAQARLAQEAFRSMSPWSLQETLELLQSGASSSLEACLKQEFELAKRAIRHPDLAEGVAGCTR